MRAAWFLLNGGWKQENLPRKLGLNRYVEVVERFCIQNRKIK
jgi:hypothetical protein